MITSRDFRDHYVAELSVHYDRDASRGTLHLSVYDSDGVTVRYELGGLREYYINEDFGCDAISQCTLINEPNNVYLSLDPFNEGAPSEKDNFCFTAASIVRAS
jgi:hypothetical protein